ncbi:hypothetical protein BLNAU_1692 [Blattamonas nauphoetae]|uniref:Ubiquitin-like domain-containing protein n=1 Tax=Blattamonas nauphoetae TaxID=2049346 RepID=A0ABQ9YHC6_9EUKA|nr:hypothetical protein BLNAU_1692 [Blattamonas nauphoetae]
MMNTLAFPLRVKVPTTQQTYDLNCLPHHTILQVKEQLVPIVKCPAEDMDIMHEADFMNDSTTLSQINFGDPKFLILFCREVDHSQGAITITVCDHKNVSKQMTISPTKKIQDLKSMVAESFFTTPNNISLVYAGRTLDHESDVISDCGIVDGAVVIATAHIIGGL